MALRTSEHEKEIRHELRQRSHALATGALVRPPATRVELEREEQANTAEITHLSARRARLWSLMAEPGIGERERDDLAYACQGAMHGLDLAYAAKRRLAVARSLLV